MGHELTPKNEAFLPVEEVIKRLQREFAFVDVSREQALEQIDGMLKYGEQIAAQVPEAAAISARLRQVRDHSVMIGLADKRRFGKAYLNFLLKPGHPISIDYEGGKHEDAAKPLLERAASALDYEITLV